ncbi:MAG: ferrous iron transporter B [Oscillospiraceae bacterium]|nr:ferrous iron transporter B [Oscillospiraceae bacterium]
MKIALAGNPNSGKTTMFNALTGRNERVGNWAGVTVEKKVAPIKKNLYRGADLLAVDLPGAYSMTPFTVEESVTATFINEANPDAIINIVDATNLSRSLFFTTQLMELGIPVVVALNKSDVNEKRETAIDVAALSSALHCPVVETVSTDAGDDGLRQVVAAAVARVGEKQVAPYQAVEQEITDKETAEQADRARFGFVNALVARVEHRKVRSHVRTRQDALDDVLTSRWAGIPIFAVVMFLVFQLSQAWVGPWLADALVGWLEAGQEALRGLVSGASDIVQALLIDGVVGGVIAVVGFLPLVMVMYFLMALLEDCGYMARVSVVLDPIFKKVGLSGKSVIPFVIGTGCAIPGVMACRTIRNERERRATAMLAPFMPCGAKLPVIALFAGAFFEDAGWVGTLMYFCGIVLIFFGALLINCITGSRFAKSYFIIELPEYKVPSFKRAFLSMCSRGWTFIVKAFTVILLCNTVVQVMQSFNWNFQPIAEGAENTSILASVAMPFAYVLIPIVGYHAWQLAAAAVTGFIAKENVVGTLAVCYGLSGMFDLEELSMLEGAGVEVAAAFGLTKAAALAYLMFNLFTPPCFAAIGAMNSEMKSAKWLWSGIALQFSIGFTVAFAVYQIGTLLTAGTMGAAFVPGLAVVAVIAAIVAVLIVRANRTADRTARVFVKE